MAMKCDLNGKDEPVKIEGDLGGIVVTENSDSDTDHVDRSDSANNAVSRIPQSLLQNTTAPVFGSVSVTDSEHVQFGNNTYFNGPVTIKQIIHSQNGVDNPSYTKSEESAKTEVSPKENIVNDVKKKQIIIVWRKSVLFGIFLGIIISVLSISLVINQILKSSQAPPDNPPKHEADNATYNMVMDSNGNFQAILLAIIILPLTLVLIYLSLLTTVEWSVNNKENLHEPYPTKCKICNTETGPEIIAPDLLRIVSRTDWVAQPVEGPLDPLIQPVPWVIITHTATETCNTQSSCVLQVRSIQTFHIESRRWFDIGYNFLVGGDGSVYYGRGWDYIGAHTLGYNKYSIGIAFIGTFNTIVPPARQIEACQKLINLGVKLGKISKDYKLFAHRQLMSTLSPGDTVYNVIKTWPHFVNDSTPVIELLPKY